MVDQLPQRIQRKRAKGWKAPEGAVYVGRPGAFGNPFYQWMGKGDDEFGAAYEARLFASWLAGTLTDDVLFRKLAGHKGGVSAILASNKIKRLGEQRASILDGLPALRGKTLMCWCPPGSPCHADVLLELANAPDQALTTTAQPGA